MEPETYLDIFRAKLAKAADEFGATDEEKVSLSERASDLWLRAERFAPLLPESVAAKLRSPSSLPSYDLLLAELTDHIPSKMMRDTVMQYVDEFEQRVTDSAKRDRAVRYVAAFYAIIESAQQSE